tara:strand:+ start:503 stop:865 length:363 start_codon:yes stop_codon:yes gene_type:complete
MILVNLILYLSFIYSSIYRRNIKKKYLLVGLIQDHHIIPREFSNRLNYTNKFYSIDCSYNLIMLPNTYGKFFINTRRPIHDNGHVNYNKYIKTLLNKYSEEEIILFLRKQLRNNKLKKLN